LIRQSIAEVQDFPTPEISFKDITPVLQDGHLFAEVSRMLSDLVRCLGNADIIVSPESRGFLFGPIVADHLGAGFVPARKPGKLPREVIEEPYGKEYGKDMIQMHKDAIKTGQKVVVVDDVLATGGTAEAIARLVEREGGIVAGYVFFIELTYLNGTELLGKDNVLSIVDYKK
jgi:adenine phosphoribosyltransferase